jgi:hypothetical protein
MAAWHGVGKLTPTVMMLSLDDARGAIQSDVFIQTR